MSSASNPCKQTGDGMFSLVVNEKADPSESFICDEEPHMLGADLAPIGYYPLQLGHVFQNKRTEKKYGIVRKLGWGESSSVWLAKVVGKERYVAMKALTINASMGVFYGIFHEFGVYVRIRDSRRANRDDHPSSQQCAIPECSMEQESVHGVHVCTIMEPFGSTVAELQLTQPDCRFPLHVVKSLARQTLLAVDFLHTEQIIHGDLKADNLFIKLDVTAQGISDFLRDHPSETYPPRFEPSVWDGPIITVKTQPLPNFGLLPSLENITVRLGDFGGAICADRITPRTLITTPEPLCAPEIILGGTWSLPIDIWAFGHMIFDLLTAKPPVAGDSPVSLLSSIAERIGKFPLEFLRGCGKRGEYFDENGNLLYVEDAQLGSLEEHLRREVSMSEQDYRATSAFIRKCLTIDPGQRATAKQLLEDDWLR